MSRKFHLPIPKKCSKTGKTMFKKQSQASYAMMRTISHTTTDMFDLHTYQCEFCDNWHFGHKSYFEQKTKKLESQISDTVSSLVD